VDIGALLAASAAQLKGKSLATPSLGNTQDVSARYWLKQHGLTTTPAGGGDVAIKPNSAAVLQFKSGQLDGGWGQSPTRPRWCSTAASGW
jgi:NitT/TauT family transport system substrate-binding protein